MPHPIDSGEGFAEAASGVEFSRTAILPFAMAGIWASSGSACSWETIAPSASPYVTKTSTSAKRSASSELTVT